MGGQASSKIDVNTSIQNHYRTVLGFENAVVNVENKTIDYNIEEKERTPIIELYDTICAEKTKEQRDAIFAEVTELLKKLCVDRPGGTYEAVGRFSVEPNAQDVKYAFVLLVMGSSNPTRCVGAKVESLQAFKNMGFMLEDLILVYAAFAYVLERTVGEDEFRGEPEQSLIFAFGNAVAAVSDGIVTTKQDFFLNDDLLNKLVGSNSDLKVFYVHIYWHLRQGQLLDWYNELEDDRLFSEEQLPILLKNRNIVDILGTWMTCRQVEYDLWVAYVNVLTFREVQVDEGEEEMIVRHIGKYILTQFVNLEAPYRANLSGSLVTWIEEQDQSDIRLMNDRSFFDNVQKELRSNIRPNWGAFRTSLDDAVQKASPYALKLRNFI